MSVKYRWKVETPRPILNRGRIFSGTIKVEDKMTDSEVHAFVLSMHNFLVNSGSKLIECVQA